MVWEKILGEEDIGIGSERASISPFVRSIQEPTGPHSDTFLSNQRMNDILNQQQVQVRSASWMRGFVTEELAVRTVAEPNARVGFRILEWANMSCTLVYVIGTVLHCVNTAATSKLLSPVVSLLMKCVSSLMLPFGLASKSAWLLDAVFGIMISPVKLLLTVLLHAVILLVPYCQLAMSLSYAVEGISDEIAILYNDEAMKSFWNANNLIRKLRICVGIVASSFIFVLRYKMITLIYGFCEKIMYGFCLWHVAAAALLVICEALLKVKVAVDMLCIHMFVQLDILEKQWGAALPLLATIPILISFLCRLSQLVLAFICQFMLLAIGLPFCLVPHYTLSKIALLLTKAARCSGMLKLSYWQQTSLTPTSSHLLTCVYYPIGYWETNALLLHNRFLSHDTHITLPAFDVNAYARELMSRCNETYRLLLAYQRQAHNQGVRSVFEQGSNLAGGQTRPLADSTWPCRRCAYFNAEELNACDICRTARTRRAVQLPLMQQAAGNAAAAHHNRIETDNIDEQLRNALQLIEDEQMAERLMLEEVAAMENSEWVGDRFSGAMFGAIFDSLIEPPLVAADHHRQQHQQQHNDALANATQAARIIADNVADRVPAVDTRNQPTLQAIGSHNQNVHNAAIEEPALQMIPDLLARPLPAGATKAGMLAEINAAFAAW